MVFQGFSIFRGSESQLENKLGLGSILGQFWQGFGRVLGCFWEAFGRVWGGSGVSGALLDASWGFPGSLGHLWGVFFAFRAVSGSACELTLAFSCLPWLSLLSLASCFALLPFAARATDFRYSFLHARA